MAVAAPVSLAETIDFKVSAKNEQTTNLITHLVEKYHYKQPRLTDELSSKIFDSYLRTLDANRSYFLASDITDFESLRYTFDDLLDAANLAPAYAMFSVYRRRALERIAYAKTILGSELTFSADGNYTLTRADASWAITSEELDELWYKRVKYDWLALKLADSPDEEIFNILNNRYTNIERRIRQIKEDDVFEFIINTYLASIEPHTSFFSPRATENFKIRMSLSLEGIGAVLQNDGEHTLVNRVLPGGPADLGGDLQAGDRITGVGQGDQKLMDVVGWRLDDVVDLIRGPKGSVVRLQILPKTEPIGGIHRILRITRDKIKLEEQAASKSILQIDVGNEKANIGVITIPTFYVDFDAKSQGDKTFRSTTKDVQSLLNDIRTQDIDGLIVDLRGNGGGSLTEAISVTGLFIKSGPIVQIRESRGTINVRKDPDRKILYSGPLLILVDRDSASASEIFAGAIQDYNRGFVAGEPTFGKGTVQNLVDLDQFGRGGSGKLGQLKVTIAQFFRVNGESTQYKGVIPDFTIPETQYRSNQRESNDSNAMRWSKIPEIKYKKFNENVLTKDAIAQISQRQKKRIASNARYQYLIRQANLDLKLAETDSFSLVESQRKTERDLRNQEIEKLKAAYLNNNASLSQLPLDSASSEEVILVEAAHLLSEVILAQSQIDQR